MERRGPYNQPLDYRMIKLIRVNRGMLQSEFSGCMGIDTATLCRLETGVFKFTPYYEEKLRNAIKRVGVTIKEIETYRALLDERDRQVRVRKGKKTN